MIVLPEFVFVCLFFYFTLPYLCLVCLLLLYFSFPSLFFYLSSATLICFKIQINLLNAILKYILHLANSTHSTCYTAITVILAFNRFNSKCIKKKKKKWSKKKSNAEVKPSVTRELSLAGITTKIIFTFLRNNLEL